LGSHGGRVIQRAAQDEATLEGGEEVIGKATTTSTSPTSLRSCSSTTTGVATCCGATTASP
jgi:hypothetical protein